MCVFDVAVLFFAAVVVVVSASVSVCIRVASRRPCGIRVKNIVHDERECYNIQISRTVRNYLIMKSALRRTQKATTKEIQNKNHTNSTAGAQRFRLANRTHARAGKVDAIGICITITLFHMQRVYVYSHIMHH